MHPGRRQVVQAGLLGALGLGLSDWFRLRAWEKSSAPRASSCILIWLDGGPSHLDTFDLKPDAPAEVRGPFKPIATRVAGLHLSEYLPRTARLADKLAILRSVTSPLGEHNLGSHYLLTGYKPNPALTYPGYGSVIAAVRTEKRDLPAHIAVPDCNQYAGEGYLPGECRPFAVGGDPSRPDFRVRDLELYPKLTADRLKRRQSFREDLDSLSRAVEREAGSDPEFEQAYRLIASPKAKKAFDLSQEKQQTRQKYGPRTLGQSCLLARRLIEAGVPFVTVTDRGWDTHDAIFNRLKEGYTGGTVGKVPTLDLALSALIEDLSERGLLESTLVVVMGEFGRTPRINTAGGRDHWPRCFSVVLAGGGVKGGQVVGTSDSRGESPAHRPIRPEDLARTIYLLLGVSAAHEFRTRDGRPVQVNQGGEVIRELL